MALNSHSWGREKKREKKLEECTGVREAMQSWRGPVRGAEFQGLLEAGRVKGGGVELERAEAAQVFNFPLNGSCCHVWR